MIDLDRRVHHDRRGRVAVVERGGVDERLERGAGLAQRLGGAVELALVEGEAADHREHAAGPRIHRHHGAGDFRHLAQPELALSFGERLDIDDVARREHLADALDRLALGPLAGFAHFTPSSGTMPTSRSLTTAPPGSRAGCRPMRAD